MNTDNIPKYSVVGPQAIANANAAAVNSQQIMTALEPISKERKDINQKIQQRKVESARRDPPNNKNDNTNQLNNLQVVVTHDMNPLEAMKGGKFAQTTTNVIQS